MQADRRCPETGAGEVSLSPAAISVIGDAFPPGRRSVPLGVHVGAASIGSGLALLCGGAVIRAVDNAPQIELPILDTVRSWQATWRPEDIGNSLAIVAGVLAPLAALIMFFGRRGFSLAIRTG